MRLLFIYSTRFSYEPSRKTLDEFETIEEGKTFENVVVAFIHAEEKDEDDPSGVEKKLVKNIKWAAKKNETKHVLLHSFAHLSESKATPDFTKEIMDKAQQRLENADYLANQTPFGYFLDLDVSAPGESTTRIFKSF